MQSDMPDSVDPSDTFDVEIHDHQTSNLNSDVWTCGATIKLSGQELADRYLDGWNPDFPTDLFTECPASAQEDADGLGWSCTAGHVYRLPAELDHLKGF